MADFELKGLDALTQDVRDAARNCPKEVEQYLNRIGNKLKQQAKENSPDKQGYTKHKIKDSWKSKMEGMTIGQLEYQLRNTAPHYHLVERGHRLVSHKGRTLGFVPGTHFFEKTLDAFQSSGVIEKEMDRFARAVKRKISHD